MNGTSHGLSRLLSKKKNETDIVNLMDFPEHIQHLVGAHLSIRDAQSLSCACKAWDLTARQSFWRAKTFQMRNKRDNGGPAAPGVDWKVSYYFYQRFIQQCNDITEVFQRIDAQSKRLSEAVEELKQRYYELEALRQLHRAARED